MGEVDSTTASLISVLVPYEEELSACLSLAGDLTRHGLMTRFEGGQGNWVGSEVLRERLGDVLNPNPETAYTADEDEAGANGVCFRGAEEGYNESNGRWETRQRNTGHWGPNVYAGCAAV